jgi:hypothetical protein
MGHGILSLILMITTHLFVNDSVLVQLALTLNPCSNIGDIGSDRKYLAIFAVIYANAPQFWRIFEV